MGHEEDAGPGQTGPQQQPPVAYGEGDDGRDTERQEQDGEQGADDHGQTGRARERGRPVQELPHPHLQRLLAEVPGGNGRQVQGQGDERAGARGKEPVGDPRPQRRADRGPQPGGGHHCQDPGDGGDDAGQHREDVTADVGVGVVAGERGQAQHNEDGPGHRQHDDAGQRPVDPAHSALDQAHHEQDNERVDQELHQDVCHQRRSCVPHHPLRPQEQLHALEQEGDGCQYDRRDLHAATAGGLCPRPEHGVVGGSRILQRERGVDRLLPRRGSRVLGGVAHR